jgi:hypothetical protein
MSSQDYPRKRATRFANLLVSINTHFAKFIEIIEMHRKELLDEERNFKIKHKIDDPNDPNTDFQEIREKLNDINKIRSKISNAQNEIDSLFKKDKHAIRSGIVKSTRKKGGKHKTKRNKIRRTLKRKLKESPERIA